MSKHSTVPMDKTFKKARYRAYQNWCRKVLPYLLESVPESAQVQLRYKLRRAFFAGFQSMYDLTEED